MLRACIPTGSAVFSNAFTKYVQKKHGLSHFLRRFIHRHKDNNNRSTLVTHQYKGLIKFPQSIEKEGTGRALKNFSVTLEAVKT